jgi:cation:H+ antiporter
MGALLKESTAIGGRVSPASLGIVVIWVVGLYVINRARKDPRWSVSMPGSQPGRHRRSQPHPEQAHPYAGASTARVVLIFGLGCAVTLGAGVALEASGNHLATRLGVNGVIFGGNAFQVCLFLVADLVAGKPVLPSSGHLNAWLAALGVALTAVYGFGVIGRPQHTHARLGPDSLLALALFGLGIAGLFVVPH